ncbi:hypothetical protein NDU88_003872 [Pleurodeles waltl]|uniref:Uncharacterized protein n=1 Tax=Pleurodeles waltl TaxID=8319 RepID=A0AAV7KZQ4_PLEWA|nr:hypothetical protein NDU88_003872 [Pleurodeles waltl]
MRFLNITQASLPVLRRSAGVSSRPSKLNASCRVQVPLASLAERRPSVAQGEEAGAEGEGENGPLFRAPRTDKTACLSAGKGFRGIIYFMLALSANEEEKNRLIKHVNELAGLSFQWGRDAMFQLVPQRPRLVNGRGNEAISRLKGTLLSSLSLRVNWHTLNGCPTGKTRIKEGEQSAEKEPSGIY